MWFDVCVVSSLAACIALRLGGCFLAPRAVWLADVSCACVPLLVSCSGFGLPMHAQLLRLFVTQFLIACACLTIASLGSTHIHMQVTESGYLVRCHWQTACTISNLSAPQTTRLASCPDTTCRALLTVLLKHHKLSLLHYYCRQLQAFAAPLQGGSSYFTYLGSEQWATTTSLHNYTTQPIYKCSSRDF